MSSVVASAVYADGRRVANVPVEESGTWAARQGHFAWIGLLEPDEALLRQVQRQFDLHELAIEDALHAHQRPKIEVYGDAAFLVLRTARLQDGRIHFGETHVFAGRNYIVTVRHGASASYAPVRARCESAPEQLRRGTDFVLYAIMDYVVDCYFPVLEALEEDVSRLEQHLLHRPPTQGEVTRIAQVRRDLERLRRAASPMMEVCSRLERFPLPMIDEEMRPYYRDVYDHVIRVNEAIVSMRELLSFAFEASMMLASARQNDVTRKLAAWAAILAVPTAVAGIYGMNFEHMPELKWAYGYYGVLAAVAALCVFLYVRFKQTGWL
ncbi:MAG TPA: magnesium/cobalt transporter CorA [Azospirillum sp.]|nr:magnesium/cobalt transporter CorA [Azospirillum sp.]